MPEQNFQVGSCHIHFVVNIDLVPNALSFGKHFVKMLHYLEGSSLVDNNLVKIPCHCHFLADFGQF